MNATYCSQVAADPAAVAHVVIPDSYQQSLQPVIRAGTYADDGTGHTVLEFPTYIEVEGASLANPAQDTLPTEIADPRVFDQDKDGNPGITIKLRGLVSSDMYVVQRQTSELTGIAVSQDRLQGHYAFTSEQIVLGPESIKDLASQTALVDPNTCASTFVFVRIAESSTCEDLLANSALFN